jgi:serine/threonine-protein phosphatase 2A regulatory subunit B'
MLDLFYSENPRERDYLKTLLHRLYAKLLHLRTFIHQTVHHIFRKYVNCYIDLV